MSLTAEQAPLQNLVCEVAVEELRPVASNADRNGEFSEGVWDALAGIDLTGLTVPEAYRGSVPTG